MKPSLPTCCVAAIVLLTSTVWLSGDRVAQAVAAGSASPLPVSCDAQGLPRLLLPRLQFLSAGCSSCVGSGCCTGLGSFKPNVATGRSWPPVLLGASERGSPLQSPFMPVCLAVLCILGAFAFRNCAQLLVSVRIFVKP